MSAAAVLAVLWPLARKPRLATGAHEVLVYRDQLDEIERDRGAGLIGEAEAEAARLEVLRRLLAAADATVASKPQQPSRHRRAAAVAALVVLSAVPVGFYVALGSPGIPGQPAYARSAQPPGRQSMAALIGEVEQHLAKNPNDGAGWQVIAPVYMRLGRFDDAVMALRKSLALNGETASRDADLGEALVAAANGVVTDEAKGYFEKAAAQEAYEPKAQYFLGLADEQDGKRDLAAERWRAMLKEAPADAPWIAFVQQALARVTGAPVANVPGTAATAGPAPQDGGAAEEAAPDTVQDTVHDMSAAQRAQMIQGMVAKLADRLHADGSDLDGWLRLVRSYTVLGERAKAIGAAADARKALASRPDAVKKIDDLVKGLGLAG